MSPPSLKNVLLFPVAVSDIIKFANDVTRWMNAHPENVIAVHCKGGKGRTGLMICVWLVHSREFGEAQVHHRIGGVYVHQLTLVGHSYFNYLSPLLMISRKCPSPLNCHNFFSVLSSFSNVLTEIFYILIFSSMQGITTNVLV